MSVVAGHIELAGEQVESDLGSGSVTERMDRLPLT